MTNDEQDVRPDAGTDDTDSEASGADTGREGADAEGGEAGAEGAASGRGRGRAANEIPFADSIHGFVDDVLEGVRNFTPVASVRYPRYDFVETPTAYVLVFDLPGMKREEISVATEGEDVVVAGERQRGDWGEGAVVRRGERPYGGFRRALKMPADVELDAIKARLEQGILTVTLPRHTEPGKRQVDIEG